MDEFKVPLLIPQDLVLIQDIIGEPKPLHIVARKTGYVDEDDIASSEDGSEAEIEANLTAGFDVDDDEKTEPYSSDSSSSGSDVESRRSPGIVSQDLGDDDDLAHGGVVSTYVQTKNEVLDTSIVIPDEDEVGEHEVLDRVGEILNTLDGIVVVKGLPSDDPSHGSVRALDSDTLLVFDDRKVMGYIYETFGPTSQPFYQVKFNSAYPIKPDRVRVGREVYHVSARSRFVFVEQIKALKGSDASNVHDEEPANDELEFSDDEAEAAYKCRLKQKRGESRARSVASSRHGTPNPTLMRDQELVEEAIMSRGAYDEHGPYDIDFSQAGPSRPAPIPYDDPYSDEYNAPTTKVKDEHIEQRLAVSPSLRARGGHRDERRGRLRGRGRGRSDNESRGRFSGRRHTNEVESSEANWSSRQPNAFRGVMESRAPPMESAHAPGKLPVDPELSPSHPQFSPEHNGFWPSQQQQYPSQGYDPHYGFMQTPFVQPHINPRFASAFAIGYDAMQLQVPQYALSASYNTSNAAMNGRSHTHGRSNGTGE